MTMALTDERIQQEWQRWNTKSIPGGVSWAGILCFARAIAALERDSAGAGPAGGDLSTPATGMTPCHGCEASMEAQRAANAQVMGTMHEVLDSLVEVVAVSDKHAIILGITPAPDSPIQRAKHAIVKARAWLAANISGAS